MEQGDNGRVGPPGTSSWASPELRRTHAASGLPAALQPHLLGQLPPDGLQGAGSVGRAGQQLPKPRPFLLAERMESRGQQTPCPR